jgi:hypothetical protein
VPLTLTLRRTQWVVVMVSVYLLILVERSALG